MGIRHAHDAEAHDAGGPATRHTAPGKRTLTQGLPARPSPPGPARVSAPATSGAAAPVDRDEPFGLHLDRATADEDVARAEVILRSLVAAQRQLDRATATMRRDGEWDRTIDALLTLETVEAVERHLTEAIDTLVGASASFDASRLAFQMDATTRSLGNFLVEAFRSEAPTANTGERTEGLFARARRLRSLLGLPPHPTLSSRSPATQNGADASVIGPGLRLVGAEAARAFGWLVADEERGGVVVGAAHAITRHLDHVLWVLGGLKGPAPVVERDIDVASVPVLKIRRWLDQRQGTAQLTATFGDLVVDKLDRVRARLGLGPLGLMDTPAMPEQETEEAGREERALTTAASAYHAKLGTIFAGFEEGTKVFLAVAALERSPSLPSLWTELAKAVLVALIGNMIGPLAGALGGKLLAKSADAGVAAAATKAGAWISSTTTDAVEGVAAKIADGALSKVDSANALTRTRTLFAAWLNQTRAALNEQSWLAIDARVRDKVIAFDELDALNAGLDESSGDIATLSYQNAAHGFAALSALERLGPAPVGGGSPTSDMSAYAGTTVGQGRGAVVVGDKRGTTGVGKLDVTLFDDGEGASFAVTSFALHGMNRHMALAVLQYAEYDPDQLKLPLEVHVSFGGGPAAIVLIDETGSVQGALDWHGLTHARSTRGTAPRRADNAGFYDTPESLWATLRRHPIPHAAVVLSDDD